MTDVASASAPTSQDPAAVQDTLARLGAELSAAQEQARVERDQHVRAVAELDNVRKRAQRDVENAHRYALEKFVQELLPVADSLELAVQSASGSADVKSLIEGQAATLKQLNKALERFAVIRLNPEGAPFDPAEHEAVMMQVSASAAPNSVLQVVQCGYQLNGRLLRPARVIVARDPGAS